MNFLEEMIKQVRSSIEETMKAFNIDYSEAKQKVKNQSCAGVAVWKVLDKEFAQ